MLLIIHYLIVALYICVPAVALFFCFRRRSFIRARFLASIILGLAIGAGLEFAYASVVSADVRWWQLLLTAYLATSLLLIFKGFDLLICNFLAHLFFRRDKPPGFIRRQLAFWGRLVVLFCIGLPYIFAAGLTYRPKVQARQTPRSLFNVDYTSVHFTSSDGIRLGAWWIPSRHPNGRHAHRTILLCPGMAGNKSSQLVLVRNLIAAGYNVLALDFRAHGDSGGQLCTFGDLERRDVLAAAHWLNTIHPTQADKIFGVGESTGAAALIAAAADPGADGQSISAIVAYSAFARLDELARQMSTEVFSKPIDSLIVHVGLPLASAQTGTNLSRFSPADLVQHLWPRPILIIHSESDEIIPWTQGDELYRAASFPKDQFWLARATHKQTMQDKAVARYVVRFLNSAKPVPVI